MFRPSCSNSAQISFNGKSAGHVHHVLSKSSHHRRGGWWLLGGGVGVSRGSQGIFGMNIRHRLQQMATSEDNILSIGSIASSDHSDSRKTHNGKERRKQPLKAPFSAVTSQGPRHSFVRYAGHSQAPWYYKEISYSSAPPSLPGCPNRLDPLGALKFWKGSVSTLCTTYGVLKRLGGEALLVFAPGRLPSRRRSPICPWQIRRSALLEPARLGGQPYGSLQD